MQQISRDGFTEQEIISALTSNQRRIKFKYLLFNKTEVFKKELTTVQSGNVEYNSLAEIKTKLFFTLKEDTDIDYINDRVQPIVSLYIQNKWVDFKQGVFLLNSPIRQDMNNHVYRSVTGYDKTQILKDDLVDSFFINSGENYINKVKEIILSTGETKINIGPNPRTLSVSKSFDPGTSKLAIINELLKELNYYSLTVDEEGFYTTSPYILPENRGVDFNYITDKSSVMYENVSDELDVFNVPNVVICSMSNAEQLPLKSTAENNNPLSPISIPSRGRRVVKYEEVNSIAGQVELDEYTKRLLNNANQIYGKIIFNTAIMPFHGFLDCLNILYNSLNINDKFIETSWKMDLRVGGSMKHTCRKVVNLS